MINECVYYGKKDIMKIFNCESDKALRILKVIFTMREGNKVGKEYYVKKETFEQFFKDMQGKEIII